MSSPNDLEAHDKSAAATAAVGAEMRRGLSWTLIGAIVTNALRVVILAVLGRELTSSDFGVVAAATSVNIILYGIRDIGIGRALVQRKHLEPGHLRTSFAVSTYIGIGTSLLLVLGAPAIAGFFNIESSVNVIRVLGTLFAIRGFSATSRMMCERAMRFNAIAIFDTGSFALGSVVAMVTAVAGAGPWALVLGYLVEELSSMVCYVAAAPPLLTLRVEGDRFRELMSFGFGQTVTQIMGMLATYGDNFVVGHVLGAKDLGFYSRAYDLIKMPSFVFEAVVGRVLFPGLSKLQDHRDRVGEIFCRVLFANALVLAPASAALIVLAPEVIRIMVGRGWESTVIPLQILAVTILPRTSYKLGAIVTQAAGHANAMAVAHTVYMACVVGGAGISIRWGIIGVSITTGLAILVVFTHCTILGMMVTRTRLIDVVRAHVPGLALAALVVVVGLPLARSLRSHAFAFPLVVAVCLAAGIAVCVGLGGVWLARGRGHFAWLRSELNRLRGNVARGGG